MSLISLRARFFTMFRLGYCKAGPFAVAGTWRLASRQAMTELSTAALSRNQARAVVLLAIRPVETLSENRSATSLPIS